MDFDELSDLDTPNKSGEYSLWLRVFSTSFFELRDGKHSPAGQSFLFDRPNPFFDMISDGLGIESSVLRKRIKMTIAAARPAKVTMRGKNRRRCG